MGIRRKTYWDQINRSKAKEKARAKKRAREAERDAERRKREPQGFGPRFDEPITLTPGDALPAQWLFYPDGRIWIQDRTYFDAKIGAVTVRFKEDKIQIGAGYVPCQVENCLFPDGSRGMALAGEPHEHSGHLIWRRPTSALGEWWPGTVRFTTEDAVFEDIEQWLPAEKIEEEEYEYWLAGAMIGLDSLPDNTLFWPHFYNACTESEPLKSILRQDHYASAFYILFNEKEFVETATGHVVHYDSERRIGHILAQLRGCGEDYLDFYHGSPHERGSEPGSKEKNEILTLLEAIGFSVKA